MSYINKNFKFVKQENFDGFLRAVGLPEEKIAQIVKFAPDQKLVQDGDSYTYITNGPDGVKEIKFKSGVEFEDVIGADKIPIKTTYTVDGNVVTQNITAPQGTAVFKREYNGDELVVVITGDKFDGVAKRYYKAE
ncbi:fatty acid-binding protein 1-like [Spodoptera litura]|uniref:Fatty acid-binding protein 1-like n=1 Tax=Spodoptera litura TaxID=69820 RepID=A0A9J7EII5_SPOLT|nr:fatty acid-binding protein 1-like [Spodoptera litura]